MLTHSTALPEPGPIVRGLLSTKRVPLGTEIYNRLSETLYDEAALLDERRFREWVDMLAEDLHYTAPIRLTRSGAERDRDVMRRMMHFKEDKTSILQRIGRFDKNCAWAEDPPSRTRRFVSNIRAGECEMEGEYEVVSYLQLKRSRGDSPRIEEITAERRDVWRHTSQGYKLVRREIIVDQSVLAMSNFAVFL